MIKPFEIGQHVYFRSTTHGRASDFKDGTLVIINQGSKGVVEGYDKKGTEENISDDLMKVQITLGEHVGKIIWIPSQEFEKLS